VLALNPMYGPIMIFRLPFMAGSPDMLLMELSIFSSLLLALTGIFYFKKTEASFADLA
jgi:ABC-type polysaccharide/polyol phosphate export permease